jgi:hypothetical protein
MLNKDKRIRTNSVGFIQNKTQIACHECRVGCETSRDLSRVHLLSLSTMLDILNILPEFLKEVLRIHWES